jgi:hypothetical protein
MRVCQPARDERAADRRCGRRADALAQDTVSPTGSRDVVADTILSDGRKEFAVERRYFIAAFAQQEIETHGITSKLARGPPYSVTRGGQHDRIVRRHDVVSLTGSLRRCPLVLLHWRAPRDVHEDQRAIRESTLHRFKLDADNQTWIAARPLPILYHSDGANEFRRRVML